MQTVFLAVWQRRTGRLCSTYLVPALPPEEPTRQLPRPGRTQLAALNTFKIFLTRFRRRRILGFERVQFMSVGRETPKTEETALRILDAALELFRSEGFDSATMRRIAEKAGVATGAAYYYYASKDAIVMAFYQRACEQMQSKIATAVAGASGLEGRLRELIRVKFDYFAADRGVLRALLRNGADPKYPLSPFSNETKHIRDVDIAWFRRILDDCGFRIPRDLLPHLPAVLWFFQMGVIFFWVTDDSPDQARSTQLLQLAAKSLAALIRASALPFMRPLRKGAVKLIEVVKGDQT